MVAVDDPLSLLHPYYRGILAEGPPFALRFSDPALGPQLAMVMEAVRQGRQDLALARLPQLAAHWPGADAAMLHAFQSLLARNAGDADGAEHALRQAMAQAPADPLFPQLAAATAFACGRFAAARQHLRAATTLTGDTGWAWAALALSSALAEDWPQAAEAAAQAARHGAELGTRLAALSGLFAAIEIGQRDGLLLDLAAIDGTPADAIPRLPTLSGSLRFAGAHGPVVFVACDDAYLHQHVLDLLASLATLGQPASVHLHLFNPASDPVERIAGLSRDFPTLTLNWTAEQVTADAFGGARIYYSCARFCRLAQFIAANPVAVLAVDADVLFRKPPTAFPGLNQGDGAVVVSPQAPPWDRVIGFAVLINPTPGGGEFIRRLGQAIATNLLDGRGLWFLDQICLYLVHRALAPQGAWRALNAEESCDLGHGDQAVLWTVTSEKNADDRYNQFKAALRQSRTATD